MLAEILLLFLVAVNAINKEEACCCGGGVGSSSVFACLKMVVVVESEEGREKWAVMVLLNGAKRMVEKEKGMACDDGNGSNGFGGEKGWLWWMR